MREQHIHHHAQKHHEAEKRLKSLLSDYNPKKEKVLPIFFWTFIIVLLSILIFRNWGNIMDYFTSPDAEPQTIQTLGAKTGVVGVYRVNNQAGIDYNRFIASADTAGSITGAEANSAFGDDRGEKPAAFADILKDTIWLTNYLSTGQFMTKLDQMNAKALQKSVISTYYLGEKTVDIYSTLNSDTKLLSQIKNTLSVDLFQYLNQAVNRSDQLDEYLNLLNVELTKTNERIEDLQYKINFLTSNSKTINTASTASEKTFFDNLSIFNGPDAERELAEFIGIQNNSNEVRAKLGAYNSLQGYYKFFKPKLENLIKTIQLNRAALIAGVKVVEIQNMALPLIIQSK